MALFLLPWSKEKSKMDLVKRDLYEVWREGEKNDFPQLNPLREALLKAFRVQTKPLAPAYRRYKGRFWEELSFWVLPSKVQETIAQSSLVFSPLMGVLRVQDLLPYYELDWETPYGGKPLYRFWREHLESLLSELMDGQVVYDFLSKSERRAISLPENTRRVSFEYIKKGKRVINTLPHRAYTLRYIVEMKVSIDTLGKINFLDYRVEEIRKEGKDLKVVLRSEGKYI